jgi:hypothetical protein
MPGTQTEPVAVIGGVSLAGLTALVSAVLVCLDVFDVYNVSGEQAAAVIAVMGAMWAVFVPALIALRGIAYAPDTVQTIKEDLATAPAVEPATAATLAK